MNPTFTTVESSPEITKIIPHIEIKDTKKQYPI